MCLFFAANNEKILLALSSSLCDVPIRLYCFTAADYFIPEYIHTFKHQIARQQARARAPAQQSNIFCTNATLSYALLSPL
jgi:hypothetical protein